MALVSYDASSASENDISDDDEKLGNSRVILNGTNKDNTIQASNSVQDDLETTEKKMFSVLPQAKSKSSQVTVESDKLEDFIPTVKSIKEKKKVLITVPSLSEFDDIETEEPLPKRIRPSQKGSGLLGILPPVRIAPLSSTSFVPNMVKSKNVLSKSTNASKGMIPHSLRKNLEVKKMPVKQTVSDSDSENEDTKISENFDDEMWEKVCGRPKQKVIIEEPDIKPSTTEINIAPEPQKPYEGLDNEAFKELVGKSKRPLGNIKLIDINEEEILPDKDLWMTKSLTDPEMAPKTQIENPVDPTRKKKHHITFLAQQAKANEQELKSAWATSKNNRLMSRAKYGF